MITDAEKIEWFNSSMEWLNQFGDLDELDESSDAIHKASKDFFL